MRELSRRQVLQLGPAAGAAGLLPAPLTGCSPAAAHPAGHRRPDGFRQPAVRRSRRRVLDVTLTAVPGVVGIGAARPVTTHTYDGGLPGATWEVDPGDALRIDLVDDLPPLHPDGHEGHTTDLDRPHEWTSTNLHTHGMHVSPRGTATTSSSPSSGAAGTTTRSRCRGTTRVASSGTTPTGTGASPSRSAAAWPA